MPPASTPTPRTAAGEVEPGFRGWGRVISDFDTGLYAFETVKPAPVRPAAEEEQADAHGRGHRLRPMAPHLNLWIVARGINIGLNTRMYFATRPRRTPPTRCSA
jgi:protocatechuate 3,4-dioxygenase, alpha subunit